MEPEEKIAEKQPRLKVGESTPVELSTSQDNCSACGLPRNVKTDSMTGWIFRSGRCRCDEKPALSAAGALEPNEETEDKELSASLGLPERYRVLQLAGEGGMGQVYRAFDRETEREVAIKVLKRELVQEEGSLKRFTREVSAAARLQHDSIVKVFDSGATNDGRPYMVMEHLRGKTLDRIIEENVFIGWETALQIFIKV